MIKTKSLGEALALISPAISGKTMQILGHALVKSENGLTTVTGFDTEIQIVSKFESISDGDMAICIDYDKLNKFCKVSSGAEIELKIKDDKAILKAKSRSTISTLPADNYPTMSEKVVEMVSVKVDASELATALDSVLYACAVQDVRHYLLGALFKVSGGKLSIIGCNGARIAITSIEVVSNADIECIIPRKTAMTLAKTFRSGEIELMLCKSSMAIDDGFVAISGKCIDAKYPVFDKAFDLKRHTAAVIDSKVLIDSIESVSITTGDFFAISMEFKKDTMTLTSFTGTDESVITVDCVYSGDDCTIGLSSVLLSEAVKKTSGLINLEVGMKSENVLITDSTSTRHLVMSIRI